MLLLYFTKSSRQEVFCKKAVFRKFAGLKENTCARVSFLIKLLKKETLEKVFSCEYCKISKNTCSYRTAPMATSVHRC